MISGHEILVRVAETVAHIVTPQTTDLRRLPEAVAEHTPEYTLTQQEVDWIEVSVAARLAGTTPPPPLTRHTS